MLQWFCEEVSTDDELEKQKVFKFRADLAYRRHDYEKALREYLNCFSLVPDSNIAIRRDVLESLSRCYCRLGRPEKALEIAEQLRKDATNTGHLSAVLNLQLTLHCSSGELRKQISTLQDLISLMPCNPCHWKKLGMAYLNIFKSLPSSGPARTATVSPARPDGCNGVADPSQRRSSDCLEGVSIAGPYTRHGEEENPISDSHRGEPEVKTTTEEQGNEEAQDVWLRACVCFVRSSLLFRMVKFQQSSFVSQSNRRAREEIEGALRTLDLKEEVLRVITEVSTEGPHTVTRLVE
ncbi:ZHX1R protein, partial [Amia calva]|nr:ZHX1R protein [Amia calva]